MNNIKHANSFDFMRLAGSLMVLYSHGFEIAGLQVPVIRAFSSFGTLGLFIFFAISGYLVSTSWLSDPNLLRFALRRSLRIIPGLAVVILLSVLVLGPIATTLPITTYLGHSATRRYLENIALYISYTLPGCFEHVPLANVVNGSLWSLPPEVLMYVFLGVLGLASLVEKRVFMALFSAAIGIGALYLLRSTPLTVPLVHWAIPAHPAPILFLGMELHQVMFVAPYFWAGCLFRLFRDRIKLTTNGAIAAFMLMAVLPHGSLLWLWSWFAIPYIVLAFCTQNDPMFSLPPWLGDLSYGIYIYAFPLQQMVYYYGHSTLSFWQMQAMSAALTLFCSYLSWHFVENPALRLKPTRRKVAA
jgi:peptidoglycan/LPS O-acetylase OafA/YrhL